MESSRIEQIKNDLLHLLTTISRNSNELLEKWANTPGNVPDEVDRANMHLEMDFACTQLLREGVNKQNILTALRKIDEGTYGICEECEEEISSGRLNAIPHARLCINCQMELEKGREMVA